MKINKILNKKMHNILLIDILISITLASYATTKTLIKMTLTKITEHFALLNKLRDETRIFTKEVPNQLKDKLKNTLPMIKCYCKKNHGSDCLLVRINNGDVYYIPKNIECYNNIIDNIINGTNKSSCIKTILIAAPFEAIKRIINLTIYNKFINLPIVSSHIICTNDTEFINKIMQYIESETKLYFYKIEFFFKMWLMEMAKDQSI